VTAVRFHPADRHLFLSGGSKGGLFCWDTRVQMPVLTIAEDHPVRQFKGLLGQVQDFAFLDSNHFVTATDLVKRSTFDKSLLVWDYRVGAVISSQIYPEAYSCPSLCVHPGGRHFVAQSSGGYIAVFSTATPFKLDKTRRMVGHQVAGHRVQCNFNHEGRRLASGSADGRLLVYDWATARQVHSLHAHVAPCVSVAFLPSLKTSILASTSWDGEIALWSGL